MGTECNVERRRTWWGDRALLQPRFPLILPDDLLEDCNGIVVQTGSKQLSKHRVRPVHPIDQRGMGLYLVLQFPFFVVEIPYPEIAIGRRRNQTLPVIVKGSVADEFPMARVDLLCFLLRMAEKNEIYHHESDHNKQDTLCTMKTESSTARSKMIWKRSNNLPRSLSTSIPPLASHGYGPPSVGNARRVPVSGSLFPSLASSSYACLRNRTCRLPAIPLLARHVSERESA